MSGKLHLICMKTEGFHAKIRCNLNDISYLSETQKNNLFIIMFSLKKYISSYSFVSRIKTMTCVCRRYGRDVQKIKMAAVLQLHFRD